MQDLILTFCVSSGQDYKASTSVNDDSRVSNLLYKQFIGNNDSRVVTYYYKMFIRLATGQWFEI